MNLSTINDSRDVKTTTPEGKAYRVDIVNEPVHVTTSEVGDSINVYDEINSVAGLATATIVTYTVPVGKSLVLQRIEFSGENRAVYSVDLNDVVEAKYRTYYTHFNGNLTFEDLKLAAGDILKLIVENKSSMTGDFNANIQGNLIDA